LQTFGKQIKSNLVQKFPNQFGVMPAIQCNCHCESEVLWWHRLLS